MERGELSAALAAGMVETRYQPIVRLRDRAPIAVEALARLNHPALGTLSPERFVPQIEDAGLAEELTDCISRCAFADMRGAGIDALDLAVGLNLPLEVLLIPAALERLDAQRRATGLSAARVVIELTESQPVSDLTALRHAVERLRVAGYRAVIDDVSPAVPLVAELMKLPFAGLKLDKAVVQDMGADAAARAFVTTTVERARTRGLLVTAEGVEDETVWQTISIAGADNAQGFFIAEPMTAAEIPAWFAAWRRRTS